MWIAGECGLLLWLGLSAIWLWRRGPAACLIDGSGLLLAYAAASATAWLADAAMAAAGGNLWLRLAVDVAAGTAALAAVLRTWRRRSAGWRQRLDAAGAGRLWGRLALAGVVAIWLAANLALYALAANCLAAAAPAAALQARDRSLFTGRLLGSAARTAWDADLAAQGRALHGLGAGVDRLLDAAGADRLLEAMAAAAWAASLDDESRGRLVAASPELQRLAQDPQLLAVESDARLMRLVGEAADGSLAAVYALGGEPKIGALIASPAMRSALAAVDPVRLHRAAAGAAADGPAWELAGVASSLDLDARLAAAGWTAVPGGRLAWDDGQRFGVARTPRLAGGPRELWIASPAGVSCWLDRTLLHPAGAGAWRSYALPDRAGTVILLLDFAGCGTRACQVRWR